MSNLVCRVYLDAEVLAGVDELDEQGELIAKTLVVFLANELVLHFANELVEAFALLLAIGYDGLVVLDT